MKVFDFWSIFLRFHVRNNSYRKFLFWQLFALLQRLSFRHFFMFRTNPYLKKLAKFRLKKWKFLNIIHFFKAILLGITYSRIYMGRFLFCVKGSDYCFFRYSSIIHISIKLSKIQWKSGVFSLLWSKNKIHISVLLSWLYVVFS